MPDIFDWLQQQGNVEQEEMYRTFNCGIGMIVVVPATQLEDAISLLTAEGENAWHVGNITKSTQGSAQVNLVD